MEPWSHYSPYNSTLKFRTQDSKFYSQEFTKLSEKIMRIHARDVHVYWKNLRMPRPKMASKSRPYKKKTYRRDGSSRPRNTYFATPPRFPRWITNPGPEIKSRVYPQVTAAILPNAEMAVGNAALNTLDIGGQENQRIGNKILMKFFETRITFLPGTAPVNETCHSQCRIILIYDKMCRGVAPNATEYFDTGGATPKFTDIANPDRTNSRFITLIDYVCRPSTEIDNNDVMAPVSFHLKKVFDLQTIFRSTGGTTADIDQGGLFLITGGNGDTGGALGGLTASVIIGYTDQ
ncbi:MAG: capsid protein [Circoviridae sp.]|nr:MAG: capsid protein [Circoviridae sp.]